MPFVAETQDVSAVIFSTPWHLPRRPVYSFKLVLVPGRDTIDPNAIREATGPSLCPEEKSSKHISQLGETQ